MIRFSHRALHRGQKSFKTKDLEGKKSLIFRETGRNSEQNKCTCARRRVTERPQSRGGMAFDVMLCPETGNVKRRPQHLRKLEKRKKKGTRRTKEEIDEKLKHAEKRRKVSPSVNVTIFLLHSIISLVCNHQVRSQWNLNPDLHITNTVLLAFHFCSRSLVQSY